MSAICTMRTLYSSCKTALSSPAVCKYPFRSVEHDEPPTQKPDAVEVSLDSSYLTDIPQHGQANTSCDAASTCRSSSQTLRPDDQLVGRNVIRSRQPQPALQKTPLRAGKKMTGSLARPVSEISRGGPLGISPMPLGCIATSSKPSSSETPKTKSGSLMQPNHSASGRLIYQEKFVWRRKFSSLQAV